MFKRPSTFYFLNHNVLMKCWFLRLCVCFEYFGGDGRFKWFHQPVQSLENSSRTQRDQSGQHQEGQHLHSDIKNKEKMIKNKSLFSDCWCYWTPQKSFHRTEGKEVDHFYSNYFSTHSDIIVVFESFLYMIQELQDVQPLQAAVQKTVHTLKRSFTHIQPIINSVLERTHLHLQHTNSKTSAQSTNRNACCF